MIALSVLIFIRVVLVTLLLLALPHKILNFASFVQQTVVLHSALAMQPRGVALAAVLVEAIVLGGLLIGGPTLPWVFLLFALMVGTYTIVIVAAARRLRGTTCNCFGGTANQVTSLTALRNVLIISICIGGTLIAQIDPPLALRIPTPPLLILVAVGASCGHLITRIPTLAPVLANGR